MPDAPESRGGGASKPACAQRLEVAGSLAEHERHAIDARAFP